MFKPMAATVLFALIASLIIALTLMPVLASYAFRRKHVEKETWLMRRASRAYAAGSTKGDYGSRFVTAGIAHSLVCGIAFHCAVSGCGVYSDLG